jgi:hypothetical protein
MLREVIEHVGKKLGAAYLNSQYLVKQDLRVPGG